jgi:hypothetical protein
MVVEMVHTFYILRDLLKTFEANYRPYGTIDNINHTIYELRRNLTKKSFILVSTNKLNGFLAYSCSPWCFLVVVSKFETRISLDSDLSLDLSRIRWYNDYTLPQGHEGCIMKNKAHRSSFGNLLW